MSKLRCPLSDAVYDAVVAAALALVKDLELDGLPVAQRQTRKLPAIQEALDTTPLLLLIPRDQPDTIGQASTHHWNHGYQLDMIFITAGNLDLALDTAITKWRETLRDAFLPPLCISAQVPSIWDTKVSNKPIIDRRKVSRLYNYSGISVQFVSEEAE